MVQNRMVKKGFIGAIVLAVILFGGVILGLMCTERIPAGYVGVVYNMNGGVDGEVLQQGWHLVSPTKKVTTYSIGIEQSYLTAESKGDSLMMRASTSRPLTGRRFVLIWSSPIALTKTV